MCFFIYFFYLCFVLFFYSKRNLSTLYKEMIQLYCGVDMHISMEQAVVYMQSILKLFNRDSLDRH